MAELVDALDSGSSGRPCRFESCHRHQSRTDMEFDIKRVKIVVMVPQDHVEVVRTAVCKLGAGVIGNYSFCTTSSNVVGTFLPNDDAKPYIGSKNTLEYVEEVKLEFVCDVNIARQVLCVIREVHPYEEPAIDIIPLIDEGTL